MTNIEPSILKKQAIQSALDHEWENAITLNNQLLEINPKDIATLNRLGFALTQTGSIAKAKSIYQNVLEIDKFNPIAQKCLKKLSNLKDSTVKATNGIIKMRASFIEEPGLTRTVSLVRPGDATTLSLISIGLPVILTAKKRRVIVETNAGEYIGCIPDDIGLRLEKLLKLGYKYDSFIKANQDKKVTIFIREISRSNKGNDLPSFPSTGAIVIETDVAIHKHQLEESPIDTTPTGED